MIMARPFLLLSKQCCLTRDTGFWAQLRRPRQVRSVADHPRSLSFAVKAQVIEG